MYEFPIRVSITIPSRIEQRHGCDSTAAPHGTIVSVRLHDEEVKVIERARAITGFDISRSGFIRTAAYRVALEICKHHDAYINNHNEAGHDRVLGSVTEFTR
jgi:uncharacterized protein (DUF1778 family)